MPKRKAKSKATGRSSGAKAQRDTSIPPTKKFKLKPIDFHQIGTDPIIENMTKFTWDKRNNFDIGTEVLDQISLDGLNGITFGRLIRILDAISPKLNCSKDVSAQDFIWTTLVKFMGRHYGSKVTAYFVDSSQLATSTESNNKKSSQSSSQDMKSPNKALLIDKEIKLPKDTIARISKTECSLFAVQDGPIMGSCQSYLTRQDITEDLINISKQSTDILDILHAVDNKYGLSRVFFVADQDSRFKAILPEWADPNVDIKMREYACLELIGRTRSLGVVFPNDKALGRYRIILTAKKFISQYQPKCTSHIVHHIIRYSSYVLEPSEEGKIYKGPPASTSANNQNQDFEVDDDFEDEADYENEPTAKSVCCEPRRLMIDKDMLKMVYHVIAFSKGRSPFDIRRKLRLPKFHVRNHLKNLANIELIGSHAKRMSDRTFRIYRARHKSLLYRKRLREKLHRSKLKLMGGKIKFDEIDLRAKSILGARRSQFSQAEDSLLIICRICCLLLEPNLTKKVSFCVNKRFIRDLLHDELCESHDKTADACLRRIKYLRKLPNNIMSIDELTAELRDDTDIIRFTQQRETAKTEDKLNKLFTQILKVVRAKLPHLLGLSSSSGNLITQRQAIKINSFTDLKKRYELIDCQTNSSSRYKPSPGTTVLQLAQALEVRYKLDVNECNEMSSIASLASICGHNNFNIILKLKIPQVIVGLDEGNDSYKQLCAKAKKTTKDLLQNLSSASLNPDSRRALFMLRNELKSQALDKFGNLADALIVQPCNANFSCDETFELNEVIQSNGEAYEITENHMKMIELVLSWLLIMPGVELEKLSSLVEHLSKEVSLDETVSLMKDLEMIIEQRVEHEPRLGGILKIPKRKGFTRTFEPQADAYIKFGQLLTRSTIKR